MSIKHLFIALVALLVIASCGKKGDLEAPDTTASLAEDR